MNFHDEAFDEATLTKLDIFDQYLRVWLPVFVAKPEPLFKKLHIFDFCAGPGTDGDGKPGSPLRILECLREYAGNYGEKFQGWNKVEIHVHFFDGDAEKIRQVTDKVESESLAPQGIKLDIRTLPFDKALAEHEKLSRDKSVAKLMIIDQFGVTMVKDDVFKKLITFPTCDFLFFIASSTLNRFRDHENIPQKIRKIKDPREVHRAVTDYYRDLVPAGQEYFLAPFSIRKNTNIYGIIFGSGHPRAMDKFLKVVWEKAPANGEADFDINREGIDNPSPMIPGLEESLTKVGAFEAMLKKTILSGECQNELTMIRLCFLHGMSLQKATKPIAELKKDKKIEINFRTPQSENWDNPRAVKLAKG